MIKFTTLYSGSSGNCSLVQSKEANILVDAGFNYKKLLSYLRTQNLAPEDIDGILITHNHTDHTNALTGWGKLHNTLVGAHEKLAPTLGDTYRLKNLDSFTDKFAFRDIEIDFTTISHDAEYTCGYRFYDGQNYVATVTDAGFMSESNMDFLLPCKTVLLESNHDLEMLVNGSYSYPLKKRIMSNKGHLSNVQAGEVIDTLLSYGNVKNIILGHLSQNNNTHELAFSQAVSVVKARGLQENVDVNIVVADQHIVGDTIE